MPNNLEGQWVRSTSAKSKG